MKQYIIILCLCFGAFTTYAQQMLISDMQYKWAQLHMTDGQVKNGLVKLVKKSGKTADLIYKENPSSRTSTIQNKSIKYIIVGKEKDGVVDGPKMRFVQTGKTKLKTLEGIIVEGDKVILYGRAVSQYTGMNYANYKKDQYFIELLDSDKVIPIYGASNAAIKNKLLKYIPNCSALKKALDSEQFMNDDNEKTFIGKYNLQKICNFINSSCR